MDQIFLWKCSRLSTRDRTTEGRAGKKNVGEVEAGSQEMEGVSVLGTIAAEWVFQAPTLRDGLEGIMPKMIPVVMKDVGINT